MFSIANDRQNPDTVAPPSFARGVEETIACIDALQKVATISGCVRGCLSIDRGGARSLILAEATDFAIGDLWRPRRVTLH